MTNLLQDGTDWLIDRLEEEAGRTVTYTRGVLTLAMTAICEEQEYAVTDDKRLIPVRIVSHDFILRRSQITFGGAVSDPRAGDRIIDNAGTFELMPLGVSPCFQWLDPDGDMVLVHTKKVA
jgi:hypothetical protein